MGARHYCTYFDRNYLLKGLALYNSLCNHAGDFVLWVLCLDAETRDILSQYAAPQIQIVTLNELEQWEPRLAAVRSDRTLIEYYWTSTPTWIANVMSRVAEGEMVSYLDADLFFFASPEAIEAEAGDATVIIHEHRYAPEHQKMARESGIYNVGLTAFRVGLRGWKAVHWWQAACLEACYLRPAQGMCGDQKYLDDWPERFTGVHVLQQLGVGLAPWNVANYTFTSRDGRLWVDQQPLIFYHFHGFQQLTSKLSVQHGYDLPRPIQRHVYRPYLQALQEARNVVGEMQVGWPAPTRRPKWRELARDALRGRLLWA